MIGGLFFLKGIIPAIGFYECNKRSLKKKKGRRSCEQFGLFMVTAWVLCFVLAERNCWWVAEFAGEGFPRRT